MNLERARFNMIEQQIRTWNVLDQDVLNLLSTVRREEFVPEEYRNLAFSDMEIPLPNGQNMLTPKIEARVLQALKIKCDDSVLEVGSGSGYMAALLAYQARVVTTVELDPALKAYAERNLEHYQVRNAHVVLGNGGQGWPSEKGHALYDVMVFSGSFPVLPQDLIYQLKLGGRLILFLGNAPLMKAQLITRSSETIFQTEQLFETYITPFNQIEIPSRFEF